MGKLKHNPDVLVLAEDLAYEFEVAISTVHRWYDGVAVPRDRMTNLILSYIDELTGAHKTQYWIEVDPETKNPIGGVCYAYYKDDRPVEGDWILVEEVNE